MTEKKRHKQEVEDKHRFENNGEFKSIINVEISSMKIELASQEESISDLIKHAITIKKFFDNSKRSNKFTG